ncbi:hypothetical protein AB0G02_32250, partial [Actinosynnema sp. NPDC023658]
MVELRLGRAPTTPPWSPLAAVAAAGAEWLAEDDPQLHALLLAEHGEREENLVLRAPGPAPDPTTTASAAVLPADPVSGVDGGPVERLAVERARAAFGAEYADVRPYSGVEARSLVLDAVLGPDEVVLDARLGAGPRDGRGHRTEEHLFAVGEEIDYDGLAAFADRARPAVLLCGGEPHPLTPDFARLRAISDDVGALLVVDISHVAGLVVTGLLANPVDHAHVTTFDVATGLPGARGGV